MLKLTEHLELTRCPHCSVDHPSLLKASEFSTNNHSGKNPRCWRMYRCQGCGGVVTASSYTWNEAVKEIFPTVVNVEESIPSKGREYLTQAINSLHSPAGAVMLAASAVDAMLKAKNYKEGSLYGRIDKAVAEHLITKEMGQWAHKVRLDANEERHADEESQLPNEDDAKRSIKFALALGQFLFVLPAQVHEGLTEATKKTL